MGRPKKAHSDAAEATVASSTALTRIAHDSARYSAIVTEVEAKFGDGMEFDEERLALRAMELMQDINTYAAPKLHEVGCILIRVHANHPESYVNFLGRIGMSTRAAQKCVQSTKRFGGTAERKKLLDRLSPTKIQELLAIDDESIDAWAKGEEALGLTLDEIDRMSVYQLRDALRKERNERAEEKADDVAIIQAKEDRINKLLGRSARSKQQAVNELAQELHAAAINAASYAGQMIETADAIDAKAAEFDEEISPEVSDAIQKDADLICEWLRKITERFGA